MSQLENDLDQLRKNLEHYKLSQARLEATWQELEQERLKIIQELDNLGVAPDKLSSYLQELETDVRSQLEAIQQELDGHQPAVQ